MKILLVGGGGREHALAAAIAASPLCDALIAAPGNPGIAAHARCVPIAADNLSELVALAITERVDLVVVGPEAPLVAGLADGIRSAGIACFGPSAAAAAIEGSKALMKTIAVEAGIPTARHATFTDLAAARAHAAAGPFPIVIKADGLAAGKGVIIAETRAEAIAAVDGMMADRLFGASGDTIVIEAFLTGEEVSVFTLHDGTGTIRLLGACQDHKRAFAGDTGPNTGGMGAYCPAAVLTPALVDRVMAEIVAPADAALRARGAPFVGVLFTGLMLTADGPKLIEFNCRFGDPETQALLPMLDADLLPLLHATATGRLASLAAPALKPGAAVCVVMATEGYPGEVARGSAIHGLDRAAAAGATVFQAATRADADGTLRANGGRVLAVTGFGPTVAAAQRAAMAGIAAIDWPEGFHRPDIGWRAIQRESAG
jgi:phosphoribosylamine--glycine ligase